MLKAYAAGVNAIAQSGQALPLEYRLLGATPEPWEPMHSLATLKLPANFDCEYARAGYVVRVDPGVTEIELLVADMSVPLDTASV